MASITSMFDEHNRKYGKKFEEGVAYQAQTPIRKALETLQPGKTIRVTLVDDDYKINDTEATIKNENGTLVNNADRTQQVVIDIFGVPRLGKTKTITDVIQEGGRRGRKSRRHRTRKAHRKSRRSTRRHR